MKKDRRIKDAREFQSIMQKKKFRNSSNFSVYFAHKKDEKTRIGISVPKKLGNAVLRNLTKRQVRHMLRSIDVDSLEFDTIILVRKNYFNNTFDSNRKDLEKLMKTVKM